MNRAAYSGLAIKRAGWHFLSGKAASALLTLIILLWLVRQLPIEEYGAYVTFIAATELAFAISFIGLPWLAARYLPEFRVHGTRGLLAALCWQLVGIHGAAVLAFTLVLSVLLRNYLNWLDLAEHLSAARIYLLVIVAEGIGRFASVNLLGALLQQGVAQLSQILRNLVFLILLVAIHYNGGLNLLWVAWAELAAASIATLFALAGLGRYLSKLDTQPQSQTWTAPSIWMMWPTALRMYAAEMLTLANSPQVILNMIQFWLGAGAAATFGFLRSLYNLTWQYLPATLLFGLVRPKLVASYADGSDIAVLSRNANLAGKLSLLALMPAVAFTAVGGETLVGWLSGGKFPDTGLLFFGLMLALIPYSQRQLLETVAVATGHAALCVQAGIAVLIVPLLVWLMLASGLGLWSGVVGIVIGQLIFILIVLYGVTAKTGYQSDLKSFVRLAAAAVASYAGALAVPVSSSTVVSLVSIGMGGLLSYLIAVWFLRPITDSERSRLLTFLRRRRRG